MLMNKYTLTFKKIFKNFALYIINPKWKSTPLKLMTIRATELLSKIKILAKISTHYCKILIIVFVGGLAINSRQSFTAPTVRNISMRIASK